MFPPSPPHHDTCPTVTTTSSPRHHHPTTSNNPILTLISPPYFPPSPAVPHPAPPPHVRNHSPVCPAPGSPRSPRGVRRGWWGGADGSEEQNFPEILRTCKLSDAATHTLATLPNTHTSGKCVNLAFLPSFSIYISIENGVRGFRFPGGWLHWLHGTRGDSVVNVGNPQQKDEFLRTDTTPAGSLVSFRQVCG